MLQALKALLSSKKFLTAIIAMIVWAAGRWGIELDVGEVTAFVSPLMTAILGQGIADIRRPAANDNAAPSTNTEKLAS